MKWAGDMVIMNDERLLKRSEAKRLQSARKTTAKTGGLQSARKTTAKTGGLPENRPTKNNGGRKVQKKWPPTGSDGNNRKSNCAAEWRMTGRTPRSGKREYRAVLLPVPNKSSMRVTMRN